MVESANDDAKVVVTAVFVDDDEDAESFSPTEVVTSDVELEVGSCFSGADDDEVALDEDEGIAVSVADVVAGLSSSVALGPVS